MFFVRRFSATWATLRESQLPRTSPRCKTSWGSGFPRPASSSTPSNCRMSSSGGTMCFSVSAVEKNSLKQNEQTLQSLLSQLCLWTNSSCHDNNILMVINFICYMYLLYICIVIYICIFTKCINGHRNIVATTTTSQYWKQINKNVYKYKRRSKSGAALGILKYLIVKVGNKKKI